MSKTKLTDSEKLILERIECYFDDQETLNDLKMKLNDLKKDDSNSIAQYGTEYIKTNNVGSKVENHILKKERTREKIKGLQRKIAELDSAMNSLKDGQKAVIDNILLGKKIVTIAKEMGKSKQQIYKFRKNALKNMKNFLDL